MIDTAMQALDSIRNKELDSLFDAGDILYEQCESCHLKFNPAVIKVN